eukprot:765407-Hanusia_phi.AAC.6
MLAALTADRIASSLSIWFIAELTHVLPSVAHVAAHDMPDAPSRNHRDCSSTSPNIWQRS